MAASDDFPRGWILNETFNANTPLLTMPGVTGITHVLTSAYFKGYSQNTTSALAALLEVSTGDILDYFVLTEPAATSSPSVDSCSWSGKIAAPSGQALTVQFSVSLLTSMAGVLVIAGYDV